MNKLLHHLNIHHTNHSEENTKIECLWCGKNSLSIDNEQPFEFQCFSCKQSGNAYTIIRHFYDSLPNLSREQSLTLVKHKRGIKSTTLKNIGVKSNSNTYYIPVYNNLNSLTSLHKYKIGDDAVFTSPKPVALTIIGLQHLNKKHTNVMICEGHWDYLTLYDYDLGTDTDLLGVSGSYYPASYLHYLKNKHICLLFDNDSAGKAGIKHIAKNIKLTGTEIKSISYLDWSKISLPEYDTIPLKFDIRDLHNSLKAT